MSGPEALPAAIADCLGALASIDAAWNGSAGNPCMMERHKERRLAENDVIAVLRAAGWVVAMRWDEATVCAAGVRSKSTQGLGGALNNWLKRAREKVAAA
ncbi:MAG: hypothetical protein ACK4Z0_05690 [Sphingomonadaceae bacterium]